MLQRRTCVAVSLACVHRTGQKGEINGKSANLNNALKNIIYQEYATNPSQIPLGELVVVFDADMQVRPTLPAVGSSCACMLATCAPTEALSQ